MAIHMVGYDLKKKDIHDYTNLINALKAYPAWCHEIDSTWFIKTEQSVKEVRDNLIRHIHQDDKLIVVKASNVAAWTNSVSTASADWLRKNIPQA